MLDRTSSRLAKTKNSEDIRGNIVYFVCLDGQTKIHHQPVLFSSTASPFMCINCLNASCAFVLIFVFV